MSDFTPITTQEEFDSAIKERLGREKDKFTQQYSDYDDVKSQNAEYEKTIAAQKSRIEELTGKQGASEKEIADLRGKIAGHEKAQMKIKIAHEAGLPYELAGKLSGDDEEAIKKDAETLKKFIGKPQAQPLKDTEPPAGDAKKAALKTMLNDLKM